MVITGLYLRSLIIALRLSFINFLFSSENIFPSFFLLFSHVVLITAYSYNRHLSPENRRDFIDSMSIKIRLGFLLTIFPG